MQRAQVEASFQSDVYVPIFTQWAADIVEHYAEDYSIADKLLQSQTKHFLSELHELQKLDHTLAITSITYSVLWTSLLQGAPTILMEAYPDVPFITEPILGGLFPAPWLYYGWDNFVSQLKAQTDKNALGRYLRLPELKSRGILAAQMVLSNYSMLVKAHLRPLEETDEWHQLRKATPFFVSFGEYMEHHTPLLGVVPDIDLAYLEEGDSAAFCRFSNCQFSSCSFKGIHLQNTVFTNCTFKSVFLEACPLVDARFTNCTFEDCRFSGISLAGAEFTSTRFSSSVFHNVWVRTGQGNAATDHLFCGAPRFFHCLLEDILFDGSDFSDILLSGCSLVNICASDSQLCEQLSSQLKTEEDV